MAISLLFGQRNNVEVLEAVRLLQESGVKTYLMEEDLEVDKNYDELELTIRTAINQSENEHRGENIRMDMKFRAEQGLSGLYKRQCFGYVLDIRRITRALPRGRLFLSA